jgi:hypothetical protein
MKIITRKEAHAAGLTRWFTGKPCRKLGHIAELTERGCCECERLRGKEAYEALGSPETRREKYRKDYQKHKERYHKYYQKKRNDKFCSRVNESVNQGLQTASARGAILDVNVAIDLFKTQHNAFEFLEEMES